PHRDTTSRRHTVAQFSPASPTHDVPGELERTFTLCCWLSFASAPEGSFSGKEKLRMAVLSRFRWLILGGVSLILAVVIALATPGSAFAAASLTQISSDTFVQGTCAANATTNHHTEVEPDTFSNGSTIVATFQVGRVFDGGACDIGFATTTNNGSTW